MLRHAVPCRAVLGCALLGEAVVLIDGWGATKGSRCAPCPSRSGHMLCTTSCRCEYANVAELLLAQKSAQPGSYPQPLPCTLNQAPAWVVLNFACVFLYVSVGVRPYCLDTEVSKTPPRLPYVVKGGLVILGYTKRNVPRLFAACRIYFCPARTPSLAARGFVPVSGVVSVR